MQRMVVIATLLLALGGCTPSNEEQDSKAAARKRDAGFVGHLEGVRRGSEGAFGHAADATR